LDVNEVVADMARMLRHVLGDDVKLETQLARRPAVVLADPSQLEQMLMNLAVNARDAMAEGGVLTIETKLLPPSDDGRMVQLQVADTGCGMDEQTKARVFDPFFTTKPTGGTGLGLSTVYGVVTQCGGTIAVDSAPQRGSRFDIRLPAAEGDAESYHSPPQTSRPVERPHETVLLVEDRVAMRALLAQMLEDEGYRALVSHDPEDAIRIARQHPNEIHVLLTDVVMPNMSGRQVARSIVELRPNLRVLFISGFSGDASLLDGDMAGRSAFVRKPVTPPELDRALRDLLADG
jgi:CheY-like chemotaxis protein